MSNVTKIIYYLLLIGSLMFVPAYSAIASFDELSARAERGDADAQAELGRVLAKLTPDSSVQRNDSEALKWLQMSASKKNAAGQNALGVLYLNGFGIEKDEKEALKYFKLSANQGFARAMINIGYMYEAGQGGLKKDTKSAFSWFRKALNTFLKAAKSGDAEAQYWVGDMVEKRLGLDEKEANNFDAVSWYEKAAAQGLPEAQRALGFIFYKNGEQQTGTPANENYKISFAWFTKSAAQGDAFAQSLLGDSYYYGRGTYKNATEAVKNWLASAKQGHAYSQYRLGIAYYNGDGVESNEIEAVKWLLLAAKQKTTISENVNKILRERFGDSVDEIEATNNLRASANLGDIAAQFKVADAYKEGRGVIKSLSRAKEIYADAQFRLGLAYQTGRGMPQNTAEAIKYFSEAAESGHAKAQYILGAMYAAGQNVSKDEIVAVQWFRKAAEQGDADAQVSLGVMYLNGQGVAGSDTEALKWFRNAAERGDATAQVKLGYMYEFGRGVASDVSEAAIWYRKAAEQGDMGAQTAMGNFHLVGKGVAQNIYQADIWFRKAAAQGSVAAQFNLGYMYERGQGVAMNLAEGANWYRKAAEQGDAGAQNNLGTMYENGRGVNKSEFEAARLYRRAADQGDANAQTNLANMYASGRGVPKNIEEAIKWWRKAADQGNATAQTNLNTLSEANQRILADRAGIKDEREQIVTRGDINGPDAAGQRLNSGANSSNAHGTDDSMEFVAILIILAVVALQMIWVWMLIDCVKYEIEQKILWILIIVFTNFIGSLVYLFFRKMVRVPRQPDEVYTKVIQDDEAAVAQENVAVRGDVDAIDDASTHNAKYIKIMWGAIITAVIAFAILIIGATAENSSVSKGGGNVSGGALLFMIFVAIVFLIAVLIAWFVPKRGLAQKCPSCERWYALELSNVEIVDENVAFRNVINRTRHYSSDGREIGRSDTPGQEFFVEQEQRHLMRCKYCDHAHYEHVVVEK